MGRMAVQRLMDLLDDPESLVPRETVLLPMLLRVARVHRAGAGRWCGVMTRVGGAGPDVARRPGGRSLRAPTSETAALCGHVSTIRPRDPGHRGHAPDKE